MIFSAPQPFEEALDSRRAKRLFPTSASSRELQALPAKIRERSMFSARTTDLNYLRAIDENINDLVAGSNNPADVRVAMRQALQSSGYTPPKGLAGTIRDLSSDKRLDLIIEMNLSFAHNYGHYAQGLDPDVLDEWPCQELLRIESRKVERDWTTRWTGAGGQLYEGRMIARKDSPVWVSISSFGLPYPPFDYNSGMGVADVDRDQAVALGAISSTDTVQAQPRDFSSEVSVNFDALSPALRAEVEAVFSEVANANFS